MRPQNDDHATEQSSASEWAAARTLVPYLWKWRTRVIIAIALLVGAKLANIALPIFMKYIVDALDSPEAQMIAVPVSLVLMYGFLRLMSIVAGEIRDLVFGRVTERAMREIALKVFRHLHRLDLDFHLSRRTGGLSRDIERGLKGISFFLRFMLFNILPTLLEIALVAIVLMIATDISFAAIALSSVVLYISFSVIFTNWRTKFIRQTNELDSKANTRAVDALLNYETVKYFANEEHEAKRYDDNMARWEEAERKSRWSLAGLNIGQAIIIAIASTWMLYLAAAGVANKTMTMGDLVMVNSYMLQLFLPLGFLGFVYREIKRSLADLGRMFHLLDQDTKIVDRDDATDLDCCATEVRFDNVQFGYNDNRQILKGVSFTIPTGKTVAVVGASGAGKSTLARLLFRFYDVNGGTISIGDDSNAKDIRDVTQASLHQAIGVVPQDTVLFNDTLYYNIQYGRPDASKEEVERAAKLAYLDKFISELPDGYNTMVGERGLKLSGGEKQRVAIARTILKDPGILILDEATSSLDSTSEQAILDALEQVAENRTTLVIAHRLSTITHADEIIVLKEGLISERGTHSQLLKADGLYAHLWNMQLTEEQAEAEEQAEVLPGDQTPL